MVGKFRWVVEEVDGVGSVRGGICMESRESMLCIVPIELDSGS